MLGYETSEELLSIQIDDLYSNPDERRLISEQIISKGFVKDREFRFLRKDGLSIWCSVTASAEYDENGGIKWTNGFVEEITERKRLAEQLRQSQKMEAIGTLAGGIAHDFNNILTAVTGYATLARMQAEDGTRISGYVDSILEGTERATHLTRSLLTFSRKQHVSLNPVDLNGIVRRMEQFLRRVIGEDIEFRTDLSSESLIVLADSGQIEQVLMNLATNARDAMRKGGIIYVTTEKVDIKKATPGLSLKQGEYAMLAFSDAGQGMSESVRQRIFEPFFTTKEVGKGTGLGLSIVYGIVKQHDGDIYVYSEPGSGTTFKIYLKLISSSPLCLDEADSCEIAGGTEAVLIAEDDTDVRRLFREVLENLGYKVIEAADGEEAVARYIEHQDDIKLLLFDVIMPKKNGKEAFEEIRKINQKIKIIFSSGYTADIINIKGFGEDYANLISKPISPAGLAAKVREVLDKD
jgi:PAS domain S-box-containing protein